MKTVGILVFVMLGFAQASGAVTDYSKMSVNELNAALVEAVKKGSYDEVQKLVQSGANVNQKFTYAESRYDDYDAKITCTLLEYAAKDGNVSIVKELIQKVEKDDINAALIVAAKEGDSDMVRELIQGSSKVGVINKAFNRVKELIQGSPRINTLNKALICSASNFPGITANLSSGKLYRDALGDYVNVIQELIKAGANVNYTDEWGNTALIEIIKESLYTKAQKNDRAKIIQALVQAGADVNHISKRGDTALMLAIENHDLDAVQILLNTQKININYVNNDEDTALIKAVQCIKSTYIVGDKQQYNDCLNSQKIVEVLLQTPGINPYYVNKKGDTAIKLLEKHQI